MSSIVGQYPDCKLDPPSPDALIAQAILGLPLRLKAHRAAHNVSMREVAKQAGISFSTVCRIESGEDYVVSNLLALVVYLDSVTG